MSAPAKLPLHVTLLTGYIPPYALPVYQEIQRGVSRLSILLSTPMERNRQWQADWDELEVHVQRTLSHRSKWRHQVGFSDSKETHIPLDTFRQLRRLQPDVVVSEELGFRSLLSSLSLLRQPRTPLVLVCNLSEHTERGRGWLRGSLRWWLAKRAWVTMVNGPSGQRYLERIGFRPETIHRFPYTIRPGLFERTPLSRSRETARDLITCGELSERKGIVPFLEALIRWCRKHPGERITWTLIGTGPLEKRVRGWSIPPNLRLEPLGYRNYDEIGPQFAQASIFVFPTLADEWGLVVNEALAAGLPVLGSRYSQAVEELIVAGRNGWLFDPTDSENTDRALASVLQTPTSVLNEMRPHCRASVAERTPKWAAEKFLAAIRAAAEMRAS